MAANAKSIKIILTDIFMLVSVAMVRDKGDSVFEDIEEPFFVKEKCLEVTIRVYDETNIK